MQKKRYILLSLGLFFILASMSRYLWVSEVEPAVYLLLLAGMGSLGFYIYADMKYIKESVTHRATRYGLNAFFSILCVLGILIALNFVSMQKYWRFDLSHDKKFTPSDQSVKLLKQLDVPINILFFASESKDSKNTAQRAAEIKKLIKAYSQYTEQVHSQIIDYLEKPDLARQYNVSISGTVIVSSGEKWEKMTAISDETLINAILRLTRKIQKKILIASGHGEPEIDDLNQFGYSKASDALKQFGYSVQKCVFSPPEPIDGSAELLIIPSGKTPLSSDEIKLIQDYVDLGGNLLILSDTYPQPSLKELCSIYGILPTESIVLDAKSYWKESRIPLTTLYGKHEITRDMTAGSVFPLARGLAPIIGHPSEPSLMPLTLSSPNSWAETELKPPNLSYTKGKDLMGPVPLAILNNRASLKNNTSKIIVFGDSDFIRNDYWEKDGNRTLFLNCVNYLLKSKNLINLNPRHIEQSIITMTEQEMNIMFYIFVLLMPLITAGIGAVVYFLRR